MRNRQKGFTLIEITIFVVIMGFLGLTILAALNLSAERSPELTHSTKAVFLAQRRMEILLMYKHYLVEIQTTLSPTPNTQGFATFTTDPCTTTFPAALCTEAGYTVTGTIIPNWTGNANLKKVDVNVTGTDVNYTISSIVSNAA